MKYFAYGSNMSMARLQERIPGAARYGVFYLPEHDLRFHKVGSDGSAKCDAFESGSAKDFILGIVFELDIGEVKILDSIEGLGRGYEQKTVSLFHQSGHSIEAMTYFATHVDSDFKPFDWYLHHVLVGARESALPAEYITKLEAVEAVVDPDLERAATQRAIHL